MIVTSENRSINVKQDRYMSDVEYTDDTIITFGVHKGKKLIDVPASYPLWVAEQEWCSEKMATYVEDNRDVLEKEVSE